MISPRAYQRIVRASALYDLVVTAPFATPWTCAATLNTLRAVHDWLGLKGTVPEPAPEVLLFANLMGSVVLIWAVARLLRPEPLLGRLDALARGMFSAWMGYAVLSGLSPILLVFLVMELGGMTLQLLPLRSRSGRPPPSIPPAIAV